MSGVNVARASDQIDALIDKPGGQERANEVEEFWKASVRKHNARVRREHRALWFAYYSNLAASLKTSADWYEARAAALLEEPEGGSR